MRAFNRDWSRRVMGGGAVVLLITDGLDREETGQLAQEMERLSLSGRRVSGSTRSFAGTGSRRAAGIRAMLPHVDAFRAGHSVAGIEALAQSLSRAEDGGEKARLMAAMEG